MKRYASVPSSKSALPQMGDDRARPGMTPTNPSERRNGESCLLLDLLRDRLEGKALPSHESMPRPSYGRPDDSKDHDGAL